MIVFREPEIESESNSTSSVTLGLLVLFLTFSDLLDLDLCVLSSEQQAGHATNARSGCCTDSNRLFAGVGCLVFSR